MATAANPAGVSIVLSSTTSAATAAVAAAAAAAADDNDDDKRPPLCQVARAAAAHDEVDHDDKKRAARDTESPDASPQRAQRPKTALRQAVSGGSLATQARDQQRQQQQQRFRSKSIRLKLRQSNITNRRVELFEQLSNSSKCERQQPAPTHRDGSGASSPEANNRGAKFRERSPSTPVSCASESSPRSAESDGIWVLGGGAERTAEADSCEPLTSGDKVDARQLGVVDENIQTTAAGAREESRETNEQCASITSPPPSDGHNSGAREALDEGEIGLTARGGGAHAEGTISARAHRELQGGAEWKGFTGGAEALDCEGAAAPTGSPGARRSPGTCAHDLRQAAREHCGEGGAREATDTDARRLLEKSAHCSRSSSSLRREQLLVDDEVDDDCDKARSCKQQGRCDGESLKHQQASDEDVARSAKNNCSCCCCEQLALGSAVPECCSNLQASSSPSSARSSLCARDRDTEPPSPPPTTSDSNCSRRACSGEAQVRRDDGETSAKTQEERAAAHADSDGGATTDVRLTHTEDDQDYVISALLSSQASPIKGIQVEESEGFVRDDAGEFGKQSSVRSKGAISHNNTSYSRNNWRLPPLATISHSVSSPDLTRNSTGDDTHQLDGSGGLGAKSRLRADKGAKKQRGLARQVSRVGRAVYSKLRRRFQAGNKRAVLEQQVGLGAGPKKLSTSGSGCIVLVESREIALGKLSKNSTSSSNRSIAAKITKLFSNVDDYSSYEHDTVPGASASVNEVSITTPLLTLTRPSSCPIRGSILTDFFENPPRAEGEKSEPGQEIEPNSGLEREPEPELEPEPEPESERASEGRADSVHSDSNSQVKSCATTAECEPELEDQYYDARAQLASLQQAPTQAQQQRSTSPIARARQLFARMFKDRNGGSNISSSSSDAANQHSTSTLFTLASSGELNGADMSKRHTGADSQLNSAALERQFAGANLHDAGEYSPLSNSVRRLT